MRLGDSGHYITVSGSFRGERIAFVVSEARGEFKRLWVILIIEIVE